MTKLIQRLSNLYAENVADLVAMTPENDDIENGDVVMLKGYYTPGDAGPQWGMRWRETGRAGATINGGFGIAGAGADDWWEAVDQTLAFAGRFGAMPSRTAAENGTQLRAAALAGVLVLHRGRYQIDQSVVVYHGVRGEPGSEIEQTAVNTEIFIVNADNIEITGVHGVGEATSGGAGLSEQSFVVIFNKVNVLVENCSTENIAGASVFIQGCKGVRIHSNFFHSASPIAHASGGDIVAWASNESLSIKDNILFSDHSQNIYLNGVSGSKTVCTGNICASLDSNFDPIPTASLRKRHAIGASYTNAGNYVGVMNISNNLCFDTNWTGIYLAGGAEFVKVQGNVLYRTSQDGPATNINGGIFVSGDANHIVIDSNCVWGHVGSSLGELPFAIQCVSERADRVRITNNTTQGSVGGILVRPHANGSFREIEIVGNRIETDGVYGIRILAAAITGVEGTVRGNFVVTSKETDAFGIAVENNSDSFYVLADNDVRFAQPRTTGLHFGIYLANLGARVVGNQVHGSGDYAFRLNAYVSGRVTREQLDVSDNRFADCRLGFGIRANNADAVVIVTRTTFDNVTFPFTGGGGISVSRDGEWIGQSMRVYDTTAPASGAYAVGDEVKFTAPAAGGHIGAVCTAAGSPGTWNTYGAIST